MSEDCLFVSVYTPACDSGSRPVLVWIHGGGLTFGWGASPTYDGARYAAEHGVVVVSIGYRLGFLANLAHPLLDEGTGTGSLSLLDQIAALQWVHQNIERFGGDAGRVTVFGESAGGMSVGALLASPATRGLIARGIVQSGGANARPLDEAADYAERVARELGVRLDYGALQRVSVDQLLAAQQELNPLAFMSRGLGLTIDGQRLRQMPVDAVAAGAARDLQVISGTTADEARVGLMIGGVDEAVDMDRSTAERRIGRALEGRGVEASAAPQLYDTFAAAREGRMADTRPFAILYAVATELEYRRYSLDLVEAQLGAGGAAWSYIFDWSIRARDGVFGSPHAIDVPFTFGQFGSMQRTGPLNEADRGVADLMMRIWAEFAANGAPPSAWPSYSLSERGTFRIGLAPGTVNAPDEPERQAIEDLLESRP